MDRHTDRQRQSENSIHPSTHTHTNTDVCVWGGGGGGGAYTQKYFNPCPAEPNYTLPLLQTV